METHELLEICLTNVSGLKKWKGSFHEAQGPSDGVEGGTFQYHPAEVIHGSLCGEEPLH